ncbi:MAG: transglutaminase-like cysteine peptidase [Candidatus Nitricoxidivorans perseverans]|uniref:Transglutaminase-like cysteine peptidase n=1 Tax=Candidatus Nitricoxidivorans perseverans TaxID=2975601 RepID=A0AA49J060_9PROT|nr:MAG: transglutaminase-like cysteine peptidase [Candidatus Nitricoxidivorans perseverans]
MTAIRHRDRSVTVAHHPGGWRPVLAAVAGSAIVGAACALDFDRLLAGIGQRFGPAAVASFRDWRRLLDEAPALSVPDKLRRVNEFFNRRILFLDDIKVWGQSDYWATPLETIGKGQGDCEDFTIAKYYTLLNAGMPNENLRLVYVKARIGGPSSTVQQAHMVLAWYATPDAEPLVLDNLITDIRPASRRPDLQPVFSFNSQGIWQGAGGGAPSAAAGPGRLSRWQDLLQRARAEGFD